MLQYVAGTAMPESSAKLPRLVDPRDWCARCGEYVATQAITTEYTSLCPVCLDDDRRSHNRVRLHSSDRGSQPLVRAPSQAGAVSNEEGVGAPFTDQEIGALRNSPPGAPETGAPSNQIGAISPIGYATARVRLAVDPSNPFGFIASPIELDRA